MANQTDKTASPESAGFGDRVMARVAWRILPFLCLLYVFNILDRINVGFARTTMQEDPELGLTKELVDRGFGLFYVGYLLFEVPSNLILRHVGARLWIARIMITWGIISTASMFVQGKESYYLVRILLGIAEAGFFPGIIFYLTAWFPARQRARATSWFMVAITLASILGNPLSGAILENLNGTLGLKGWQWLFLLEGLPTIFIGFLVPWILYDKPADAKWLSTQEKEWLTKELEQEETQRKSQGGSVHLTDLLDERILLLILLYASAAMGTNGMGAYLPTMVKERFLTPAGTGAVVDSAEASKGLFLVGVLSALPHLCALVTMVGMSWLSDKTGRRGSLIALSAFAAAMGWLGTTQFTQPEWALASLCLAQAGMMSMLPVFWTLPALFLSGAASAGGIALINAVANVGGIFAASLLGYYGPMIMFAILFHGAHMGLLAAFLVERPARVTPRESSQHGS